MTLFKTLVVFLFALSALAGCGKPETFTDEFDPVEMQRAIGQAQATFDEFVARARNPQPGDEAFSVKVKLSDSKGTEHIWLNQLELDKTPMIGKITLDAEVLHAVKAGDLCKFTREEVTDWMYMSNGKMQGNFTLRVMLKAMKAKLGL
jgi:uncharacterized protein YegJ (DUF2314 family)